MMRNFYDETVIALYEHAGRTQNDIEYVTLSDFEGKLTYLTFDKFADLANQIEYDPVVKGEPVISPSIRIGGKEWYLYRTIVEGKECWDSVGWTGKDANDDAEIYDAFDLINNRMQNRKESNRYKFI